MGAQLLLALLKDSEVEARVEVSGCNLIVPVDRFLEDQKSVCRQKKIEFMSHRHGP
jgi:hypothetical protein